MVEAFASSCDPRLLSVAQQTWSKELLFDIVMRFTEIRDAARMDNMSDKASVRYTAPPVRPNREVEGVRRMMRW